jgi:hypothetical protein
MVNGSNRKGIHFYIKCKTNNDAEMYVTSMGDPETSGYRDLRDRMTQGGLSRVGRVDLLN